MARKKPENHGENHGGSVGELIPQGHGGAIRNGGPNRGGTGRPSNEIRALFKELGYGAGVGLKQILEDQLKKQKAGQKVSPDLLLKIGEFGSRFGLKEEIDITSGGKPIGAAFADLPDQELDARIAAAESREAEKDIQPEP